MSMDKKYLLKSGINNSRIARILAKGIDLFIVLILGLLFYPFGLMLALFYLSLCDSFQEGQSVGKKMIGFAVISLEDGKPCSIKQSVIRNLPIVIPFAFAVIPLWGWIICGILAVPLIFLELYLIFKLDSGHRLGDVMADTSVIANDQNRADIRKAKNSWFEKENSAVM
jgi:uncharacterized RDD family membrane protein YckC